VTSFCCGTGLWYFLATSGDIENKTTKLREQIARDKEKVDAKPPADLPKWE
jgi:hypothetical protein